MINHDKHPALPEESGWFLYEYRGGWRAGYTGRVHAHAYHDAKTEALAIAWVEKKVADYSAGLGQRFLSAVWVPGLVVSAECREGV